MYEQLGVYTREQLFQAWMQGFDSGWEYKSDDWYPTKWVARGDFDAMLDRWEREAEEDDGDEA